MNKIFMFILMSFTFVSCGDNSENNKQSLKNNSTITEEVNFQDIFNDWKIKSYNNGDYIKPENCNLEYVIANEDKSNLGIPNDNEIEQFILDYNNDGIKDCLIIFTPIQCEGGNALMYLQTAILILSDKEKNYITNDTLLTNLFTKIESGNISLTGVNNNEIIGKFFDFTEDDARCCPSIEKDVRISFPNDIKIQ